MSLFDRQPEFPILQVKNLPYNVKAEDLYELFGQFGNVHQVRLGVEKETKGQAFVIYKNYKNCEVAMEKLRGFNFNGRYLVVSKHSVDRDVIEKLRSKTEKEDKEDKEDEESPEDD
ncbi:DEKNAAC102531 [Brettanomyces naardenensis]|uniref:DEKNAAC102531 n=1 Tax=Brettanomyces naardenensis TaxID=13370 RepID=A0A448YL52_BRENA|nr:DEKNAAC102531 [Brettanomyces naardenensis]